METNQQAYQLLAEARQLLAEANDEAHRGSSADGGNGPESAERSASRERARALQLKARTATVVSGVRKEVEEMQARAQAAAQRTEAIARREAARILTAALLEAAQIRDKSQATASGSDVSTAGEKASSGA